MSNKNTSHKKKNKKRPATSQNNVPFSPNELIAGLIDQADQIDNLISLLEKQILNMQTGIVDKDIDDEFRETINTDITIMLEELSDTRKSVGQLRLSVGTKLTLNNKSPLTLYANAVASAAQVSTKCITTMKKLTDTGIEIETIPELAQNKTDVITEEDVSSCQS